MQASGPRIWSSILKKGFMALTGLSLVGFVTIHLIGNLLLFSPDPAPFNAYSHALISLGALLIAAEIGLIAIFGIHVVSGISIAIGKRRARPSDYTVHKSAGAPSRMTFSSRSMILTGIVLLVFVVFHVKTFKYGPYYTTFVNGEEMRDLYRLVFETFQNPAYVIGYVACMTLLGLHLRHGIWSAFQSIGVNHPRLTPALVSVGLVMAIAIAAGFVAMPVWIYLNPLGVAP